MKKNDMLDLICELACAADVLSVIHMAIAETGVSSNVAADAVFAAYNHIKRIADELDYAVTHQEGGAA